MNALPRYPKGAYNLPHMPGCYGADGELKPYLRPDGSAKPELGDVVYTVHMKALGKWQVEVPLVHCTEEYSHFPADLLWRAAAEGQQLIKVAWQERNP